MGPDGDWRALSRPRYSGRELFRLLIVVAFVMGVITIAFLAGYRLGLHVGAEVGYRAARDGLVLRR